jgi:hypothetical protein
VLPRRCWVWDLSHDNSWAQNTTGNRDAVGTVIAGRPPRRPVRAGLPHTVLVLDTWRQNSARPTSSLEHGKSWEIRDRPEIGNPGNPGQARYFQFIISHLDRSAVISLDLRRCPAYDLAFEKRQGRGPGLQLRGK